MCAPTVPTTKLPWGDSIPVLGLGTWHMAENARQREDEISALRLGLDLGLAPSLGREQLRSRRHGDLVGVSGGKEVATDQVLYNLTRRGIEFDLLPWCQNRGLPVMAYSPIEQGRLLWHSALEAAAARHDATPSQVALAWVLRQDGVATVPKAGTPEHVRENHAALELQLTDEDLDELDRAFPPPTEPQPLEML